MTFNSILEVAWLFLHTLCTVRQASRETYHNTSTIVEWWNTWRSVCSDILKLEPGFKGTRAIPVQVDKYLFSGRRKFDRGKLLLVTSRHVWMVVIVMKLFQIGMKINRMRTDIFGRDELDWKWVVGVHYSATQVQFLRVKDRSAKTLIAALKTYVEPGSLIWTDERARYKKISENGCEHECVNHTENYVDRETGAHTQGVEMAWTDFKSWYKASRGTVLQTWYYEELSLAWNVFNLLDGRRNN